MIHLWMHAYVVPIPHFYASISPVTLVKVKKTPMVRERRVAKSLFLFWMLEKSPMPIQVTEEHGKQKLYDEKYEFVPMKNTVRVSDVLRAHLRACSLSSWTVCQ